MARTVDIGSRIELVPMDPHFHDITRRYAWEVYVALTIDMLSR